MLNCVMIGAGFIAVNHAEALKADPRVRVVGVVCRNPVHSEKLIEMLGDGCKYYATLEDACKAVHVDFVVICTPTDSHEEYTIKAAGLGCHVLCEKPATFTEEAFDRMVSACEAGNKKLMIAQILHFGGEMTKIREMIQDGELGKIHFLYEKRLCQHPVWATWHRNPKISGGGLYDLNVHDIDFIYSVFGMPDTVYAAGWKSPTGCWNHLATTMTWEDGTRAVCESSLEMTGNFPFSVEVRATGDRGTLRYLRSTGFNLNDGKEDRRLEFYPAGEEGMVVPEYRDGGNFNGQLDAFINAIEKDIPIPITSKEVRDVLTILRASEKSLDENRVIHMS